MKVVKFGGTSVASGPQIEKITNIVKDDETRKVIVVSAPGKRSSDDVKVTDMLIDLGEKCLNNEDTSDALAAVTGRYQSIAKELALPMTVIEEIEADLKERVMYDADNSGQFMDQMKAAGEDNNAKLIAAHFNNIGLDAVYMNPKDAGLLVTGEAGDAQVIPKAYDQLSALQKEERIIVFPGFFGYTEAGVLTTFPRGGSDITGAIVAAGVNATLYENFTDVDSVCVANPMVIDQPEEIHHMTYREMRELSYAGFTVFHDVALIPAFQHDIPVSIKNTNNPSSDGTLITASRRKEDTYYPVTGIAADKGFSIIYVRKYLMNREIGFGRRLLEMVEEEGLSYEHLPSGIDDTSVILRTSQFSLDSENRLLTRIQTELGVDDAYIEHGFAMVMVVGEGMHETVGLAARATDAIAGAGVNLEMVNQGSSEVSLTFGVKERDADNALKALYEEFFARVAKQ
ncbi:aspartate kinase [Geomicrobium sp. JCM 19037]|uniref:aspartate kinase n=1 Tax=Geomicrobium sp. JCM 19037 TaxID=1460634 RepID=UPI0005A98E5E|nr:aspartate kinase [Geomicrobium sp. JCM 19037]